MDILQFISEYWSVIAFIGVVIVSWAKYSQSISDLKLSMQEQKEEHDKQIALLQTSITSLTTRFEQHKDKITDSINLIQQDIREIMTILKKQ